MGFFKKKKNILPPAEDHIEANLANSTVYVRDLQKIYPSAKGDVQAMKDVNINVMENEFVSIVGPSGCGKSTLLRMIGGLDTATSGKIVIQDRDIIGTGADRGMVFQSYTLFPWMTVGDNIKFGLKLRKMQADQLIRMALQEDITSEDVSTNAVMPTEVKGTVDLIAKEDGIIAGLDVYARVFQMLDEKTEIDFKCKDGDEVKKGELMATLTGDIRVLLSGERVALNYLQRMSGIATYTRQVAKLLEGSKVTLLDTRKTTPNCRVFEKYAVRVGGGCNHRYNLSDGVLLKDNHIGAAGSITKAITMAKEYAPFVRKIEIEVETLEQVKEAVEAGADIIMLDNMTPEVMKQAVELIDGRAQTECSGNITKENIARIREIGVDFVSSGALTHSAPILDISMKNLHAV